MKHINFERIKRELKRKLKKNKLFSFDKILIFLLVFSVSMLCVTVYRKAIPIAAMSAETVAKGEIEKIVLECAGKAIETSGEPLYVSSTYASGELISIEANSKAVSQLCSNTVAYINEAVAKKKYIKIKVPLGSIIGGSYLHGAGPCISVRTVPYVAAYADISSSFSEAGINQTLYSVILNIVTDVTLVCADQNISFSTECHITVSEEIIIGNVPGGYVSR